MRQRPVSAGETVPNLAPMVDVIMVLLVFFLLGTSLDLAEQGVLQTELDPRSGPGGGAAIEVRPTVRIALEDMSDGQSAFVYVMGEPLGERAFDELFDYLASRRPLIDAQNPVVIGAETDVRWKYVIKAMDAAVRAGFANIQFAVSFRVGSIAESQ